MHILDDNVGIHAIILVLRNYYAHYKLGNLLVT